MGRPAPQTWDRAPCDNAAAITDGDGVASVNLFLNARPDSYQLEAAFGGDITHQSSSDRVLFNVSKRPTRITFQSDSIVASP